MDQESRRVLGIVFNTIGITPPSQIYQKPHNAPIIMIEITGPIASISILMDVGTKAVIITPSMSSNTV